MRIKDTFFGILALVLVSLPHVYTGMDLTLLLIPIVSIVLMRFLRGNIKYSLTALFLLSLFVSSLLIYGGSLRYEFFGGLAYIFFASLVLVVYIERFPSKKDS